MSKLLINDQNKALISNNGKAYAIGNMDALKGSSSPVNITAAAGKVLKRLTNIKLRCISIYIIRQLVEKI